jgi:hypothetical protein
MPASHVPLAIAALSSAGGHEPSVRPSRVRMWQARTSETPAPTAAVRAAKSIDIFCSEVIGELWGALQEPPWCASAATRCCRGSRGRDA